MRDDSVGVYVHVPFCERVCPYCDFAVVAVGTEALPPERENPYVDALRRELGARRADFAGLRLESIYLGGGTPSLLRPGSVARIVSAVREAFPPSAGLEVTLEVNPSTVERGRLPGFAEALVNRLSVGIQSFDDGVLKRLGRAHKAEEGRVTLEAARGAGFSNLSLDLMFGVPGEDPETVERDLAEVARFGPEHVSAYGLTLEEGTPYAAAVARGRLQLPSEEDLVRMFEAVPVVLSGAGLALYEISSLARPGFEAVHNRRYWERRPVLGIGVGAWSSEPRSGGAPHGARRANVKALPAYLERVSRGESAAAGPAEVLDPPTARGEAAFLGLRTARGIDAAGFAEEFGAPPREFFGPEIERLLEAGLLVEEEGGDLRLTPRGRILSDSVFEGFVPSRAAPRAGRPT